MTKQNLNQLAGVVEKVNNFATSLEQIDSIINNVSDELAQPYLMLSLLNLFNNPSSKELGPSWMAMVLKAVFTESELSIESIDDLDDISNMLLNAFDESNITVPDDVFDLLTRAFEILEVEYDL